MWNILCIHLPEPFYPNIRNAMIVLNRASVELFTGRFGGIVLHYYWLPYSMGFKMFNTNATWCHMDNDIRAVSVLTDYRCALALQSSIHCSQVCLHILYLVSIHTGCVCVCIYVCLPGNTAVGFLQSLHSDAPASQQRAYCAVLPWELICLTFFFLLERRELRVLSEWHW